MKRMHTVWMSLFVAVISLGPSQADEIIFKLRTYQDEYISGRIFMRTPEKEWFPVLHISGPEGKLTNANCSALGTLFNALPFDLMYYLEPGEHMKNCVIGEIKFRFRRKEYASALTDALSRNSTTILAASERARELQSNVVEALNNGDYSTAATNSLLLKDEVADAVGPKAADPFRILATDISATAIASMLELVKEGAKSTKGASADVGPLVFDKRQNKVVLSPNMVHAVAEYQKSLRLKSAPGTIDWTTASSLPKFDSSDLASIRPMPMF